MMEVRMLDPNLSDGDWSAAVALAYDFAREHGLSAPHRYDACRAQDGSVLVHVEAISGAAYAFRVVAGKIDGPADTAAYWIARYPQTPIGFRRRGY